MIVPYTCRYLVYKHIRAIMIGVSKYHYLETIISNMHMRQCWGNTLLSSDGLERQLGISMCHYHAIVNPQQCTGTDVRELHSWVMMFRNASQAFLAPLPVMDLKPPHLVIALRNANKHFWRHCRRGHRFKMKHLAWHKQWSHACSGSHSLCRLTLLVFFLFLVEWKWDSVWVVLTCQTTTSIIWSHS
jgi:hypothetical protein